MFSRYRRTLDEVEELNMIPVMNLFIVLIPFLLAAAAFYQVAVIPTSTPQHTANPSTDEPPADTITLNVVIQVDGTIKLAATSATLDEAEVAALSSEIPGQAGRPNTTRLQLELSRLKARFPSSDTAFVLPEDAVDVQGLVEVVDALREKQEASGAVETLFPVTVLSQFVPAPPEPEDTFEGEAIELVPDDGGADIDLEAEAVPAVPAEGGSP